MLQQIKTGFVSASKSSNLFLVNLQHNADSLGKCFGPELSKRSIDTERYLEIALFKTFNSIQLTFPLTSSMRTKKSNAHFSRGIRTELLDKVRWTIVAGVGEYFDNGRSVYEGVEAIAMRMSVLQYLLGLQSDFEVLRHYSSNWGSGFETQCIVCRRVSGTVFGWSYDPFPIQGYLPKVFCPQCHPSPLLL